MRRRFCAGGKGQVAYGVYAQGGFSSRLKSSTNSPGLLSPWSGKPVYRKRQAPYVVDVLVVSLKTKNSFSTVGSSSMGSSRYVLPPNINSADPGICAS